MAGFGPPKPKEILRTWLASLGAVLLVGLLIWAAIAFRSRPPVPYEVLSGDAVGLNDGSWDYFAAVAVEKDTTRDDLRKLLTYFQTKYAESELDRVYIVIFNTRTALLYADMGAKVAEYRQDRANSEFEKNIVN